MAVAIWTSAVRTCPRRRRASEGAELGTARGRGQKAAEERIVRAVTPAPSLHPSGPHPALFAQTISNLCLFQVLQITRRMSLHEQQSKQPCAPPPCLPKTQEPCQAKAEEVCLPPCQDPCQETCPVQAQEVCLPQCQEPNLDGCPKQGPDQCPPQCAEPCQELSQTKRVEACPQQVQETCPAPGKAQ